MPVRRLAEDRDARMLILAEGTIHEPIVGGKRTETQAWLGPMVDDGFLQEGYLDQAGGRLWMFISSPDLESAQQRLDDLPVARNGMVTFTTIGVSALRFR
jgi:hypothetical protein